MSWSQSTMTSLNVARSGRDLIVSWTSSSAAGTTFQVYFDKSLMWYGTKRSVRFPWPGKAITIDVGTVSSTDTYTSFVSSLPTSPTNRVNLSWLGGTYLGNIKEYHVFQGTTPGGSVNYSTPVAVIPASYGSAEDGWGNGGWNQGGYGVVASTLSWTTPPLVAGTWNFAVKPFDAAGNAATAVTGSASTTGPPKPPAANAAGIRLTYVLNPTTHVVTLNWSPSPS